SPWSLRIDFRLQNSDCRFERSFNLQSEFCNLKWSWSRGPAATTPGLHPGNDGSSPSGIIDWAAGPTGRRRSCTPEMRVRLPRGPLTEGSRIRLAGPLWKGGSPNGDEGSTPLPSARRPDGEMDHHT